MSWLDSMLGRLTRFTGKAKNKDVITFSLLLVIAYFIISLISIIDMTLVSNGLSFHSTLYFLTLLIFAVFLLLTLLVGITKHGKVLALLALVYLTLNALPNFYSMLYDTWQTPFITVFLTLASAVIFVFACMFAYYFFKNEPGVKKNGHTLVFNMLFLALIVAFLHYGAFAEVTVFLVLALVSYRFYNPFFALMIASYGLLRVSLLRIVFSMIYLNNVSPRFWATSEQWIGILLCLGLGIYFLVMLVFQKGLTDVISSLKETTEQLDEGFVRRNQHDKKGDA